MGLKKSRRDRGLSGNVQGFAVDNLFAYFTCVPERQWMQSYRVPLLTAKSHDRAVPYYKSLFEGCVSFQGFP